MRPTVALSSFSMRLKAWLLVGACALAGIAHAQKTIPRPEGIQPDVNFWVRVYTEVTTNEGFLHDERNLGVIYDTVNEIRAALEGLLAPEKKEEITATVEVREVFKISRVGTIAGCYVQDGKINRNDKVRLLRDGLEVYDGTISSLKRHKDDVREVEQGYECGISLENMNDIKMGDIIEAYRTVEIKRKLEGHSTSTADAG